jgi:hypothetical protein
MVVLINTISSLSPIIERLNGLAGISLESEEGRD